MKRTTVSIPDDLWLIAEREAERRGESMSGLVREALVSYLGVGGDSPRELPFAALGASGHRHTARDLEKILDDEWDAPRDR